jgi:hypothetical protein
MACDSPYVSVLNRMMPGRRSFFMRRGLPEIAR